MVELCSRRVITVFDISNHFTPAMSSGSSSTGISYQV